MFSSLSLSFIENLPPTWKFSWFPNWKPKFYRDQSKVSTMAHLIWIYTPEQYNMSKLDPICKSDVYNYVLNPMEPSTKYNYI